MGYLVAITNQKEDGGVSPVMAAIIIFMTAIAIAFVAKFWLAGISQTYARYERLEILYAYAKYYDNIDGAGNPGWRIQIHAKNTGPVDALINDIIIYGESISAFSNDIVNVTIDSSSYFRNNLGSISKKVARGEEIDIYIYLKDTANFDSKQTIDIKIHTVGENEFPVQVILP